MNPPVPTGATGPTENGAVNVVTCQDLDTAIEEHTANGFQLVAIGPADEPTWAELERNGERLILDSEPQAGVARYSDALTIPATTPTLTISHETTDGWTAGRAGIAYRDLIPDRWGGVYIASHINIAVGGPVPDYVHHHDVAHQLIYVHRGWVRVIYQDQGPSFVMEPGDCVLQPPGIRHQVLESSDNLYVTEVGCPAAHRTWVDNTMALPNGEPRPNATYGRRQRFVRHDASEAPWSTVTGTRFDAQMTAIGDATNGLAEVRFVRPGGISTGATPEPADQRQLSLRHDRDLLLVFIAAGSAEVLDGDRHLDHLTEGSSVAVPPGRDLRLSEPSEDLQVLELKCRRP
jgi:mannose-6-phosphate isomerase-like protein (cupin superfamily)